MASRFRQALPGGNEEMKRGFRVPNPKTQDDGEEAGRESGQRAAVGGRGHAGGEDAGGSRLPVY